ncbi:unnamed protein product [Closterium sp. NIES-65]|nr:unnamed protein product [Closterium sp. NIES-65]
MGVGPGLRRIGGDEFGGSRGAEEVGVRRRVVVRAVGPEIGSNAAYDVIGSLGLDTLTFLVATVIVIPAFKSLKISPILGFLLSGVALNELGLIRNITDVKALSELGILFLLFEMGLELSLERLRALAKFAFGMGLPQVLLTTLDGSKASAAHLSSLDSSLPPALPLSSLQVLLTTLAFTAFELPIDNAIGTRALEFLFGAKADLVNIRSLDEAIVIGAALALSSSAFVLQVGSCSCSAQVSRSLQGSDFTDDSVFPLLALEGAQDFTDDSVFPLLALEGAKSLLGLGALLYTGRIALRRLFEFVAESRSSEAFIALCLLTVTGTALITSKLGFSDSLGAFLAGALLAETNYRTQVEADIRPFRGLLLGLFFVTTGSSIDLNRYCCQRSWLLGLDNRTIAAPLVFPHHSLSAFLPPSTAASIGEANILALLAGLIGIKAAIVTPFNSLSPTLASEWPNILALLTGLIGIKAAIITALGPRVGLTLSESVRTGLLLSQGGEFAFVVFALANQLGVLPLELNRLLIIVVVLSMALTPFLDALGRRAAEYIEDNIESRDAATVAAAGVKGSMEGQQVSPCLSAVAARAVSGVGGVAESVGRLGAGGNETMSEADGGMEGQQVSPCLSAVAAGGAGPIVTLGFNRMGQVLTSVPSPPYSRINPLLLMSPSQAGASHSTHFAGAEPIVISVFNQMGQVLTSVPSPPYPSIPVSPTTITGKAHPTLRTSPVPLYARAVDAVHLSELRRAGATDVVLESAETRLYAAAGDGGDAGRPGVCAISPSRPPLIQPLLLFSPVPSLQTGLRLGSMLLQDMGVMRDDVVFVRRLMRDAMDQRALSASSSNPPTSSPPASSRNSQGKASPSSLVATRRLRLTACCSTLSDGEDFVDRNLSLDASQLPAGATMPPSLDSPAVLGEGFGSEGLQAAAGERLVYFSDGDDFVDVKLELPQSGDFPREK